MKTVGELLSQSRQQQGLSLQEVAQTIKIKPDYLVALEKNQFDRLPHPAFTKGFLRKYATFLSLNPETVLAMFRRDFVEDQTGHILPRSLVKPVKPPPRFFSFSYLLLFLALVSFLSFLGYQLYKYTSLPKLVLTQPLEDEVYTSPVPIKGKTDPGNTLKVNQQEIFVDDQGNFFFELNLPIGRQTLTVIAINPQGKTRSLQRTFQVVK